jgi:thiamine biosynthesis lipoprotein
MLSGSKMRQSYIAVLAMALLLLLSGCNKAPQGAQQYHLQGSTMGTYYSVKFYTDTPPVLAELQQQLDKELELINDLMSTYRPDSELMRFNALTSTEPQQLSAQTTEVVAEAIRIGQQTAGILDITVGPLVELWGFGAAGRIERAPTAEQIDAITPYVGIDKLQLTGAGLSKLDPRVALDLSTIAKGYGVDRLADILLSHGISQFLVDIGGDMRIGAAKPDGHWRLAIEKPISSGRAVQRILNLEHISLATSGDYRNYFEQDGVRFSHLIDPRTAQPIQHRTVSSTVLHPNAMTADAYATTLNVMATDEALAFAEQHGIAVLIIEKTADGFVERLSSAFTPFISEH